MKTIIYLVRHAESPYDEGNERTRGLTAKGKVDAEKVTKLLIGEGIDIIISSPYSRAVLSVEGMAQPLNLEIETFEDLRERHFASDYIIDLMSNIRNNFYNPEYALPGGESNADCQNTNCSAQNHINRTQREENCYWNTRSCNDFDDKSF